MLHQCNIACFLFVRVNPRGVWFLKHFRCRFFTTKKNAIQTHFVGFLEVVL